MRRVLPSGVALVVLAVGLAGCGGGPASEQTGAGGPNRVVIKVPGMT
jgi:hypothetical protein